jgi:hypothetical protein
MRYKNTLFYNARNYKQQREEITGSHKTLFSRIFQKANEKHSLTFLFFFLKEIICYSSFSLAP